MERYDRPRLIPTKRISGTFRYGLRFRYEDPLLEASLAKKGILIPLLLVPRDGEAFEVLSGHKRLFYAKQKRWKEVPAVVVKEEFSAQELFFLALYSNWNQSFSDLDRMVTLRRAREEFSVSLERIQEEVLPALGLPPQRGLVPLYEAVGKLILPIHQLINEGKLAFRGCSALNRFSPEEQTFLAGSVFRKTHLGSNQILLLSEWLSDLKRMKKASLGHFFEDGEIQKALSHSKMDPGTRGQKIFERIHALRFPKLADAKKRFAKLQASVRQTHEVFLQRPNGSESGGIVLRTRLEGREGIEKVLEFLETHRETLETFL